MLRSAYILMYSNYPEVHSERKLSMVKGYEDTWQFFFLLVIYAMRWLPITLTFYPYCILIKG